MAIIKSDGVIMIIPHSGHTMSGRHIEQPVHLFRVDWDSPGQTLSMTSSSSSLVWPECKRYAFCRAETVDGAILIAKYHHGTTGTNFVATRCLVT